MALKSPTSNCLLCLAPSGRVTDLCSECERELPFIRRSCFRCGVPSTQLLCGTCLVGRSPFERCFAPLTYCDPVDRLIVSFKDHHDLRLGRLMATLVGERYAALTPRTFRPSILTPVPLTPDRLRSRGFNQSLIISEYIERSLPGTRTIELCTRIRHTESQRSLSAGERLLNMKNAFHCKRRLKGEHIAIVDDVVTTASTVSELARTLKLAGAGEVEVIALARTPVGPS